ncbi:MAG: PucC family protein, partial [Chloroflexota bacterium]
LLLVMLSLFGVGAGLMLASLHRAALYDVTEQDMGTASGLYSMIRFMGSALGAAVGGILLQNYLNQFNNDPLPAFQNVFLWFTAFAILGLLVSVLIPNDQTA